MGIWKREEMFAEEDAHVTTCLTELTRGEHGVRFFKVVTDVADGFRVEALSGIWEGEAFVVLTYYMFVVD